MSTTQAQANTIIAIKPSKNIGCEQGARDITKVESDLFCIHIVKIISYLQFQYKL